MTQEWYYKIKDTEVFLHIEQEILASKAKAFLYILKAWKHHSFMEEQNKQNKTPQTNPNPFKILLEIKLLVKRKGLKNNKL